jgi:hypothetical protein
MGAKARNYKKIMIPFIWIPEKTKGKSLPQAKIEIWKITSNGLAKACKITGQALWHWFFSWNLRKKTHPEHPQLEREEFENLKARYPYSQGPML